MSERRGEEQLSVGAVSGKRGTADGKKGRGGGDVVTVGMGAEQEARQGWAGGQSLQDVQGKGVFGREVKWAQGPGTVGPTFVVKFVAHSEPQSPEPCSVVPAKPPPSATHRASLLPCESTSRTALRTMMAGS